MVAVFATTLNDIVVANTATTPPGVWEKIEYPISNTEYPTEEGKSKKKLDSRLRGNDTGGAPVPWLLL